MRASLVTPSKLKCVACDTKFVDASRIGDRIPICGGCYGFSREPQPQLVKNRCRACLKCAKTIPRYMSLCYACTEKPTQENTRQCSRCSVLIRAGTKCFACSQLGANEMLRQALHDIRTTPDRFCDSCDTNIRFEPEWKKQCLSCWKKASRICTTCPTSMRYEPEWKKQCLSCWKLTITH